MLEFIEQKHSPTQIKVIGVGGAGMNAVNRMITSDFKGVDFIAVNTDEQVLRRSAASSCISIGQETTKGMGAGGDPEIGYKSAIEDKERLAQALRGNDLVFITAGMGGGTGTGATPIVAEIARSTGALVIGVVTMPFRMEGTRRMSFAENGLKALRNKVDTLITIKNDSIFKVIDQKTPVDTAFRMVDDILLNAVRGIADLINTAGLVNVDFADVRSIMGETGDAVMGAGEGFGEDRAKMAVDQAIHNSLLEDSGIEGATAVLINVCGGEDLGIFELKDVAELVTHHVDPQANIIIGLTIDPSLGERLRVVVIATGFHARRKSKQQQHEPLVAAVGTQNVSQWLDYGKKENDNNMENPFSSMHQGETVLHPPVEQKSDSLHNISPEEYVALQSSLDKNEKDVKKEPKKKISLKDIDIPAFLRRQK